MSILLCKYGAVRNIINHRTQAVPNLLFALPTKPSTLAVSTASRAHIALQPPEYLTHILGAYLFPFEIFRYCHWFSDCGSFVAGGSFGSTYKTVSKRPAVNSIG
jgi:hypothetical protein